MIPEPVLVDRAQQIDKIWIFLVCRVVESDQTVVVPVSHCEAGSLIHVVPVPHGSDENGVVAVDGVL